MKARVTLSMTGLLMMQNGTKKRGRGWQQEVLCHPLVPVPIHVTVSLVPTLKAHPPQKQRRSLPLCLPSQDSQPSCSKRHIPLFVLD